MPLPNACPLCLVVAVPHYNSLGMRTRHSGEYGVFYSSLYQKKIIYLMKTNCVYLGYNSYFNRNFKMPLYLNSLNNLWK
jgi:hypothetical protein